MRFSIEKLERLKMLSSELLKEQKRNGELSERLRQMTLHNSTQRQREKSSYSLDLGCRQVDSYAAKISAIVQELGFNDIEKGEVIVNDGWADRKTVR